MARGKLRWRYEDFCWFYEQLTLPEGRPARLEGFQRLILRTIFTTGRVELLVLIPKGHAKTTLMAALAIFHLLITHNANVYIGAADKVQADEMYRFAAHFAESEPELAARLKVLRGTREIRSRVDQGFIRVLASDDSKQGGKRQGFNPTLALIDELHAHENDNLYIDMRSGLFKRKGLLVTITTAGWDTEGVLGKLRQSFLDMPEAQRGLIATTDGRVRKHKDGRLTIATKPSGNSAMLEWAIRDDDDADDMSTVKLANPASWVTIASLEDAKESLTPWTFLRYRCNRWTLTFESWLPEGCLDLIYEPGLTLVPGLPSFGAIDMGRYRDSAAFTVVQKRPDGTVPAWAWIWRSGGQADPVPYDKPRAAIKTAHESLSLSAVGYDPRYFDQSAAELLDAGVPMELFPQSNERMCPAAADLRTAIVGNRAEGLEPAMRHNGDPEFARHLMAAIPKEVGDGMFKLVKSRSNGPPIDATVALAMAHRLSLIEPAGIGAEWW